MKNKVIIYAILLSLATTYAVAQGGEEMSEEDRNWMEYMTPGEMHKMMASWDGEWAETITMWMDPEAPPTKSEASCVNRMIMGGRYQESVHTGNFGGMPFEGRSTVGFDNAMNKFVSTWVDNMGSGIMYMEGDWDEETSSITFLGTSIDPTTGEKMDVEELFRVVDEKTQQMEMYMVVGDEKIKTMEIEFKRK
jgi:hypothetical protein